MTSLWTALGLMVLVSLTPTASALAAQLAPSTSINLLSGADVNHDGVVSRAEFIAARAARFDDLDRRHLGYLSMDTLPRFAASNPKMTSGLQMLIAGADVNHDGRVTRAEFVNAPTPVFAQADANGDGMVDRAELAALKAR